MIKRRGELTVGAKSACRSEQMMSSSAMDRQSTMEVHLKTLQDFPQIFRNPLHPVLMPESLVRDHPVESAKKNKSNDAKD
jgi:hypothetical protein